jgi:deoxyribonuclease-1-like protein
VQRLVSLVTLGVMGGLGWLFFKGGGLEQLSLAPSARPPAASSSSNYQTPGPWSGPTTAPDETPANYQPASSGQANVGPSAGPALRIASFNIQDFGNSKAAKSYVMYTLADIVRQFDIVAVQEISTKNEYLIPNFIKLINQSGRKYDHVIGRRLGNTTQKEQYAYLFDTQRVEVDHQSVYTLGDPDNLLEREPLVATFRAREVDPDLAFTFTLVTIHTDPSPGVVEQELDALAEVYRVVRRSSRGEDDIILLGDFNADDRHLGRLGQLPGISPLIAGVWTNTRQNREYDNIIIQQASTTEYAGRSGVFDVIRRYNLTQQQALEVSDHFPVWAEFSVYERDFAGRIASRRQSADR